MEERRSEVKSVIVISGVRDCMILTRRHLELVPLRDGGNDHNGYSEIIASSHEFLELGKLIPL